MEITRRKSLTGSRYLSFVIEREEYCIEIIKIKEIMAMTELTPVPQTPNFVRGVINLRGKIIPIVDLRLKFGLPYREYNNRTCIIVVELLKDEISTLMGVTVDTIQEVVNIAEDRICQIPLISAKIKSDYISGMVEQDSRVMIVLDIENIIAEDEFVILEEMSSS